MTPHRKREPTLVMGAVALVALTCGVAGGAALMAHVTRPAPETFAVRALPLMPEVRLTPADLLTAPQHASPAPDEWTDDTPVLQARLTPARMAPPPPAPPPPPSAPTTTTTVATPTSAVATATAALPADSPTQPANLALAQTDDRKICVKAPANVAVTPAPPPPLRLHYEPTLRHPALDIAPIGPAPEEERRIRLSALLAEALQQ